MTWHVTQECTYDTLRLWNDLFSPRESQSILSRHKWGVVRIGSMIIFHLNKLWIAKFSLLCDVMFLARPKGKFDIDPIGINPGLWGRVRFRVWFGLGLGLREGWVDMSPMTWIGPIGFGRPILRDFFPVLGVTLWGRLPIDKYIRQISPAVSPEILHYTVWRTFHSLLRWRMIILPILTTSLIHFSLKVERMYFLNLGVKELMMSSLNTDQPLSLGSLDGRVYSVLFW